MTITKKCASTFFMLLVCLSFMAQKSSLAATWSKEDIQQIIISESRKSKYVTPALALAVAEIESGFRADPISSKGAVGVMQIMPLTAKSVFNVPRFQLFDPVINIRLGVRFLDQLIARYHGRIDLALSHYNGGSKVGKWPNSRIIPATRPYVKKVLAAAQRHKQTAPQQGRPRYQGRILHAAHTPHTSSGKAWQSALDEAEFWLQKARTSSRLKPSVQKMRSSELTQLHRKMISNRKRFREFLDTQ